MFDRRSTPGTIPGQLPATAYEREFDEFNSLNYIELPIKEQARGLRQDPGEGVDGGGAP